jgi:hypothetical protein
MIHIFPFCYDILQIESNMKIMGPHNPVNIIYLYASYY